MTKKILLVDEYNVVSPNPYKNLIERETKGEVEVTHVKTYNDAFNEAVSGKYNPIVMNLGLGMEGAGIPEKNKEELRKGGSSAVDVYLKNQIVKYFNEVLKKDSPKIIFLEPLGSNLSKEDKKDVAESLQAPTTDPLKIVEAVQRHI